VGGSRVPEPPHREGGAQQKMRWGGGGGEPQGAKKKNRKGGKGGGNTWNRGVPHPLPSENKAVLGRGKGEGKTPNKIQKPGSEST